MSSVGDRRIFNETETTLIVETTSQLFPRAWKRAVEAEDLKATKNLDSAKVATTLYNKFPAIFGSESVKAITVRMCAVSSTFTSVN